MTKHFIDAETLLGESLRLAAAVHASGYRPDLILGVWRGGAPIAIAVHEYFAFRGHCCEHLPVRVSSYTGIDEQTERIAIHGLPGLIAEVACHRRLLIVDDVVDSGRSLTALLAALRSEGADRELRTACPWYKRRNSRTGLVPDYHLHETDAWLVFPHELVGLDRDEIRAGKGRLAPLLLDLPG